MPPTPATSHPTPVVGLPSGKLEDLRGVARYQKGINGCILAYFALVLLFFGLVFFLPPSLFRVSLVWIVTLAAMAVIGMGVMSSFGLATMFYGVASGILVGFVSLLPLVGLVPLFIMNQKATNVLKANGFHVGFLGANLAEIDARIAGG